MAALTLPMVAERLACPVATARKLVASRQIRGFKLGIQWRVESADLEAFVDERRGLGGRVVTMATHRGGIRDTGKAFVPPRPKRRA